MHLSNDRKYFDKIHLSHTLIQVVNRKGNENLNFYHSIVTANANYTNPLVLQLNA
jgi:hypothetical protein